MKEHSASRIIEASPDRIWDVLTDASGWTEWDPGVTKFEGEIGPGEKLTIYTKISPDRAFPVTVSEFVPGKEMTWSSGMPLGLFRGERTFTLTPKGEGKVEFKVREVFSGLLLPLIGRTIPDLTESFEQHAEGLKQRAEQAG